VLKRSPLYGTGFFRLWVGESASLAGARITAFAVPIFAVLVLGAQAWEMGLLGAAGSAATLFFGLSMGVWADRYDRIRVMHLANLGRVLALLSIPVLWWTGHLSIPVLVLVTFTVSALSLLFDSAMSAYLPQLVGKERLTAANSWMQASASVGNTVGPGVSGLLVQVLGAPVAILVDAVSYLVSSLAMKTLPRHRSPGGTGVADRHLAAIKVGVTLIWRDPIQRPLTFASAHFNLFTTMFFALYALYAIRSLGFSPFLLGVVSVCGGVAGLCGAGVADRLARRFGHGRVLVVAYAVPGAAGLLVPFAAAADLAVSAVLVAASSALWIGSIVINLILSETIKQALVPHHLLGRVTSAIRFVSWGVEPFGALIGGALGSAAFGVRNTLVLASIGVITSAAWPLWSVARLPKHFVDDSRRPDGDPTADAPPEHPVQPPATARSD
jgi:MFS family permease